MMAKLGFALAAFLALALSPNAQAADCDTTQSQGGIAKITSANPGDWAKVELKCGGVSLGTCTATVAAGATSAECTFPKVKLAAGAWECPITTNNPKAATGGSCN